MTVFKAGDPTHTTATMSSTGSQAVLAANAARVTATFQNIGTLPVFMKVNATAVANQGIKIAVGGDYTMSRELGNLSITAVNGILGSTGSVVVSVQEFVEV